MDRVTVPTKAFSIAIRGVKDQLELLDALFRSIQAENALDARRCIPASAPYSGFASWGVAPTLLFQKHSAFCNHYRDIAVNVALAVVVDERNGDICVNDALSQWYAEDALWFRFCRS